MAEWVELCPILEVCDREKGYKGGGRRWYPWWRKTAAIEQLSVKLKEILAAARERHWKSSRRFRGGGDRNAEESEDGEGRDGYQDYGTETPPQTEIRRRVDKGEAG